MVPGVRIGTHITHTHHTHTKPIFPIWLQHKPRKLRMSFFSSINALDDIERDRNDNEAFRPFLLTAIGVDVAWGPTTLSFSPSPSSLLLSSSTRVVVVVLLSFAFLCARAAVGVPMFGWTDTDRWLVGGGVAYNDSNVPVSTERSVM